MQVSPSLPGPSAFFAIFQEEEVFVVSYISKTMICGGIVAATILCCAPLQAAAPGPSQAELDGSASATNNWLMTNKSYDGQRYVALDQITAQNAAQLKQVCSYDSGLPAQAQSTPLLYDG